MQFYSELAEAQVYGDKAMKKAANNWLTDVSQFKPIWEYCGYGNLVYGLEFQVSQSDFSAGKFRHLVKQQE